MLELDNLTGIQWVYGAGAGPAGRWIDVYRRIQDAGKCLQVVGYCGLDEFKALAPHLKPQGLGFWPIGVFPRAEAEEFIAWTAGWAAGKR